ncbi:MAG: hypothetical protein H6813_01955 [Phycisphaeraceae bacterium]|nr:hypothetical protein [Phycisphaeraceae bacterium]
MATSIRKPAGLTARILSILAILPLLWIGAAPGATAAPDQPSSELDAELVRIATATRLTRSAILVLRSTRPPMPVDYQLCAEQLRLALTLDPDNPYILRPMREALYRAGDTVGYAEATRRLAELEPEDTVLQLAVISGRIRAIQNADDRIAAYERILGPDGRSIDAAVRSRLAFDGALLAQELGDNDRSVRLLTLATQLDPTNKPAAAKAADYFLTTESDPRGRIEILANVVLADPLDPAAHLNLSREFLRHGATHAGERFLTHAVDLWRLQGIQQDENSLLQRFALQWLHRGAQSVLDDLDKLESIQRFSIEMQRKQLEEANEDPEQVPPYKPDAVMERVRLTIGSAEGDEELVNQSIQRIEKSIYDIILQTQQALKGENPPSSEDAERQISGLLVQSLYLRLWSGTQLDKAEGTIAEISKVTGPRAVTPEALDRYRGWLAAQRGDRAEAQRLLTPTSGEEPFAMLGLGVAAEKADARRDAIKCYAKVALDEPGTLMGVWAQRRLERLLGSNLTPTPLATEMERLADTLPRSIDRMAAGPSAFVDFKTELVSDEIDRLGRCLVRMSVRNVGAIPVGVGERAPIRTSALCIPRLTMSGHLLTETIEPEVVSFERRLRLMPKETMSFVVWADLGQVGSVMDIDSMLPASLRWRTILGFEIDGNGQYSAGGTSLEDTTGIASRSSLSPLGDSTEDVALAIELAESGRPLLTTLLGARALLLLTVSKGASDAVEVQQGVCNAIAERYKTMTPMERAFTLVMIPPAQAVPAMQIVDDTAHTMMDPLTQIMLIRRLADPDDPRFAEGVASEDPTVRKLATLFHHRMNLINRIRAGAASAEGQDADQAP